MARIIDAFTQFFDNAGDPLVKGKLQFLESGTNNTDKDTFKDSAMTTPNTNPVLLDGDGRCPSVFGSGVYNVILFTSDDVQIQQFDPVGASSSGAQFDIWDASEVYDIGDIVRGSDGEYYQSFINSNSNNNPTVSPAQWDLITIVKSYIADASGTADVITADFTPVIHSLVNNTRVTVTATAANASTVPTFAPNGLTAKVIVKSGNQPLLASDIGGSGHQLDMIYRSGADKWELLNPSTANYIDKSESVRIVQIANAAGTADALTASFTPSFTTLTDGLEVRVRALLSNTTTTPTINIDGLGAKPIVKNGNVTLDISDIAGLGHELQAVYNFTNDNFELLNPSYGQQLSKAWANFNGQGVLAIRSSFNISSITDNGTGNYTPILIANMIDANYSVNLSPNSTDLTGVDDFTINAGARSGYIINSSKAVGSFTINTGANGTPSVKLDFLAVDFSVFER